MNAYLIQTQRIHCERGFTLTEFLMASIITALVMLALVGVFIVGYRLYHGGTVRAWEQQRVNNAMERIADLLRPARDVKIYRSYGTSLSQTNIGAYLFAAGAGWSSGVYRSGTVLYFVPNTVTDNRATSTDDVILVTCVMPATLFCYTTRWIEITLALSDPRATNREVLRAVTSIAPRNVR
ncbi:MAG: prepilin-type N-terminal cleavage/methylation domain-containing protein [bacterium]|nr:prepilin-type N-terminal cleavage/methylation domain-containing protein [bacterium]